MASDPVFQNANAQNNPGTYRTQSGRFLHLVLNGIALGGIQNYTFTESYGTHWMGEVGSDHKDPEFNMRQVNGSCERLSINLMKFRDVILGGDAGKINIDFRDYQFTLVESYQEAYGRDASDAGVPGVATKSGPIQETIYTVMFTDVTARQTDTVTLRRESVNFIGTAVNADTQTPTADQFALA